MSYDANKGKLVNPTVNDMIQVLQEQMKVYGNTKVNFYIEVEELDNDIQIDFYKDALVLKFNYK